MEIPEELDLMTQAAAAGITTGVVVAQHTGKRQPELPQQARMRVLPSLMSPTTSRASGRISSSTAWSL